MRIAITGKLGRSTFLECFVEYRGDRAFARSLPRRHGLFLLLLHGCVEAVHVERVAGILRGFLHEVDGKAISFGAKHIFCERDVSPTVLEAIDTLSDGDLITLAFKLEAIRSYDLRDGKPAHRDELAARLARYVPTWTGEQRPCAYAESVAITGEY